MDRLIRLKRVEEEEAGKSQGKTWEEGLKEECAVHCGEEHQGRKGKEARKEHVAGADVVTQHSTLADFKCQL